MTRRKIVGPLPRSPRRRDQLPAVLAPHKWKPGESANPGGVPKTTREVALLARQYSPAAVRRLAQIIFDPEAKHRDDAYAAMLILSWGVGRPKEHIQLDVDRAEADAGRPPVGDEAGRVRAIVEILGEAGALEFTTGAAPAEIEGDSFTLRYYEEFGANATPSGRQLMFSFTVGKVGK